MLTLQQTFCARHDCGVGEFKRRLFWAALPPWARLPAWVMGGYNARFFAPDRRLIASLAEARHLDDVREEIRDFFLAPENGRWLRHRLRLRVSSQRLKAVVRHYLPDAGSRSPFRDSARSQPHAIG